MAPIATDLFTARRRVGEAQRHDQVEQNGAHHRCLVLQEGARGERSTVARIRAAKPVPRQQAEDDDCHGDDQRALAAHRGSLLRPGRQHGRDRDPQERRAHALPQRHQPHEHQHEGGQRHVHRRHGAKAEGRLPQQQHRLLEARPQADGHHEQHHTQQQHQLEDGGGIIDDSRVTIPPRQVSWENSMYRPQRARDSHAIDLTTLRYTSESIVEIDMGPEMSKETRTGRCRRI